MLSMSIVINLDKLFIAVNFCRQFFAAYRVAILLHDAEYINKIYD